MKKEPSIFIEHILKQILKIKEDLKLTEHNK